MQFDTSNNSSFSLQVPGLQLAVDSTSLGEAKTCLRKYFLGVVAGWTPREESVHLTFGLWLHEGVEKYHHQRVHGENHEEALRAVVKWALGATWNRELGRGWVSGHPLKNRLTLLRTLVWYLDEKAQNDPMQVVTLANGKPAVELSFTLDLGMQSKETGEPFVLCGHLDRLVKLGDTLYVADIKSTGRTLSPSFFQGFTPGNQFSLYTIAGRVVFDEPTAGVIVDGVQVAAGFSRFERQQVLRSQDTLDEWLEDARYYVRRMEEAAISGHWPMNDKVCDLYGGCKFRAVCSRPPGAREHWLRTDYHQRVWDPLKRRGDI